MLYTTVVLAIISTTAFSQIQIAGKIESPPFSDYARFITTRVTQGRYFKQVEYTNTSDVTLELFIYYSTYGSGSGTISSMYQNASSLHLKPGESITADMNVTAATNKGNTQPLFYYRGVACQADLFNLLPGKELLTDDQATKRCIYFNVMSKMQYEMCTLLGNKTGCIMSSMSPNPNCGN